MKRVVRCVGCGELTRLYGSYAVRVEERTHVTLTGEIKLQEIEGRICKQCAIKAGYKKRGKDEG